MSQTGLNRLSLKVLQRKEDKDSLLDKIFMSLVLNVDKTVKSKKESLICCHLTSLEPISVIISDNIPRIDNMHESSCDLLSKPLNYYASQDAIKFH